MVIFIELIVLYSILIFSVIIILLYAYLIVEKLYENYKNRKKQKVYKNISGYLDDIAQELMNMKLQIFNLKL